MSTAELEVKKQKFSELLFSIQSQLEPFLNVTESFSSIEHKVKSSKALNLLYLPNLEVLSEFLIENQFKSKKFSEIDALRLFVKKMGWHFPEGSDEFLLDSHIFEIYDHQGLQIYRSFNFFKISSYSITDILTNHWWDLYERNPFIAKSLADQAIRIFSEQIKTPMHLQLQPHVATEKWSERISEAQMFHDSFVPVLDEHNNTVAILSPYRILNFQFKKPSQYLQADA